MSGHLPFAAVVGQDDAKLALTLAAVDPSIGGVLLRGQKGAAKTTLARGLAALIGESPFVELPLGATEDRLVGTLDVTAALTGGEVRFHPGLLAAADGGVLYVDEINLLPDHLVDTLLDVAVSGENRVERDGISHRHPARFVLVGSMNPEEGELRPQLLDRFGLCVEVRAPEVLEDRVEAVRRRLRFDAGEPIETQPTPTLAARRARVSDELLELSSRLALEVGAEGLRADLTLCRAAAALAGLEGRDVAGEDDLRRVAPLALAHRSRRGPFDPPTLPPDELDRALSQALAGEDRPLELGAPRRPPLPPPARAEAQRGRFVRDVAATPGSSVAIVPTVRGLARRGGAAVEQGDLRTAVRESAKERTVVLCVDLSGSMGAPARAEAATGAVVGLLAGSYQRRDRVALVGFRGDGADVLLSPTTSVEVARNRLGTLVTGGETPLAAGITAAARLVGPDDLLVMLTDGRATGGRDALDAAFTAAADVRRRRVRALVVDCEVGAARLGLAQRLAEAMGARHVRVDDLDPATLTAAIRTA